MVLYNQKRKGIKKMRTLREWIEFLGTDNKETFSIETEKHEWKNEYYHTKEKVMYDYEHFLNCEVVKVYHNNLPHMHKIIIRRTN